MFGRAKKISGSSTTGEVASKFYELTDTLAAEIRHNDNLNSEQAGQLFFYVAALVFITYEMASLNVAKNNSALVQRRGAEVWEKFYQILTKTSGMNEEAFVRRTMEESTAEIRKDFWDNKPDKLTAFSITKRLSEVFATNVRDAFDLTNKATDIAVNGASKATSAAYAIGS
jgi:hypothetical protein